MELTQREKLETIRAKVAARRSLLVAAAHRSTNNGDKSKTAALHLELGCMLPAFIAIEEATSLVSAHSTLRRETVQLRNEAQTVTDPSQLGAYDRAAKFLASLAS